MAEEVSNPFERGPYVQVAALCETVLQEGNVLSLIRIIDTLTHTQAGPKPAEDMPPFRRQMTLVLALKSGMSRGRHDVTITPFLPSMAPLPTMTVAVYLEAENRGANIIAPINMEFTVEGLHVFHVQFDGIPLTQVPLDVRYQRLTTG